MTEKLLITACGAMLLLGGCAAKVDNAANPPMLGNWTVATTLTSLNVNGVNVSASMLAAMDEDSSSADGLLTRANRSTDFRCAEPTLSNDRGVLALFNTSLTDCETVDSSSSETTRHLVMRCHHRRDIVDVTIDADFEAERGHANMRLSRSETRATGATSTTGLGLTATLTRAGDCT